MKNIQLRAFNFYKRLLASNRNKKIRTLSNKVPIVTFTFDDFPRSAYLVGGKILNNFEFKATYYTAFGLMGHQLPVGQAFIEEDIGGLYDDGHELGCHTYDHHESWITKDHEFEKSIRKNSQILSKLLPKIEFNNFSYPKTNPSPRNKAIAGKKFDSCRAGGQKNNTKKVDLNLLQSYFIDKRNNANVSELKRLIDKNIEDSGWLIISTHDVDENPSVFGCSAEYFTEITEYIANKNIDVLKVSDVINRYCAV